MSQMKHHTNHTILDIEQALVHLSAASLHDAP
jgi:hypothetical protein